MLQALMDEPVVYRSVSLDVTPPLSSTTPVPAGGCDPLPFSLGDPLPSTLPVSGGFAAPPEYVEPHSTWKVRSNVVDGSHLFETTKSIATRYGTLCEDWIPSPIHGVGKITAFSIALAEDCKTNVFFWSRQDEGEHWVECQRSCGDLLVFMKFYRQLIASLHATLSSADAHGFPSDHEHDQIDLHDPLLSELNRHACGPSSQ